MLCVAFSLVQLRLCCVNLPARTLRRESWMVFCRKEGIMGCCSAQTLVEAWFVSGISKGSEEWRVDLVLVANVAGDTGGLMGGVLGLRVVHVL